MKEKRKVTKLMKVYRIICPLLILICIVEGLRLTDIGVFASIGLWFDWLFYGSAALGIIIPTTNYFIMEKEEENKKKSE